MVGYMRHLFRILITAVADCISNNRMESNRNYYLRTSGLSDNDFIVKIDKLKL
jgi:hypothetical protein